MSYEPVQKGNPCELTYRQHIHSAYSIKKFYNADDRVEVYFPSSGGPLRTKTARNYFYTLRTWDQHAEQGVMGPIEVAYHAQIDDPGTAKTRDHQAISRYFYLWYLRHQAHLNPGNDEVLPGFEGGGLTKELQEKAERVHMISSREDGTIPARFLVGSAIQLRLLALEPQIENMQWGLLTATDGEFLVADNYSTLKFFPISPTQAFYCNDAEAVDQAVGAQEVERFNHISLNSAHRYCFARRLASCPGVP